MIKYLGSKRLLLPTIVARVQEAQPAGTVLDLFSGTSRVGHALKRAGYRVLSNDHNTYAHTLGTCYVQSDREDHENPAASLIQEFNALPGRPGFFTETYCEKSRFFQPKNGERIDAVRDAIEAKDLDPELKAVLLVSLMEAADRVDSTTGLQMAYLKTWAPRANQDLQLRLPELLPRAVAGKGAAYHLDATEAAETLSADLCYLDPPYNQHKYIGNYHIWETLVRWDRPEVYGVAQKRIDCRTRGSPYNSRSSALPAMAELLQRIRARNLLISFNNEGFISREDMEALLRERGRLSVQEVEFPRYVGARIGIYSPKGEKVGAVSHTRNVEYLYQVTRD